MMKLATLLTPEHVLLDMRAEDRWPAIVELVDHLDGVEKFDAATKTEVLEALRAREDQVSTGIGSGVAIPHAFSDRLNKVVAVFGRSDKGIEFEALDHAPVRFVILFVVPRKQYHLHLQTLAAIAKLLTNSEVRRQLREAVSRDEVLAVLDSRPARSNDRES
jgi:mannitol/fructose-specific phosphotransferase system IIA component (Ntr-type)